MTPSQQAAIDRLTRVARLMRNGGEYLLRREDLCHEDIETLLSLCTAPALAEVTGAVVAITRRAPMGDPWDHGYWRIVAEGDGVLPEAFVEEQRVRLRVEKGE